MAQSESVRRDCFYIGGTYVPAQNGQVMHRQTFVERLRGDAATQRGALVMIHGAGQSAMNWITTPNGRPGWAEWFVGRGWTVYLVDQPARGRSAWHAGLDGEQVAFTVENVQDRFTAIAETGTWPQARLHTQWPGSGRAGDPVFDQFYSSQMPSVSNTESETAMRAAGAALLDRIGPAVLMVHSQSGLFGWQIADARPELVKGIVALEPSGPPFRDAMFPSGVEKRWGLTSMPLAYDPPVTPDSPLEFVEQAEPDAPDLVRCWEQKSPPRRLVNLAGKPVLIVTAEASYHACYDHCTAKYLSQAGVPNHVLRLADHGIHGNGHMIMLEKNSLEIAALLDDWMQANIG